MNDRFNSLDEFLAWVESKLPETTYLVKNNPRHDEAMQAAYAIWNLTAASGNDNFQFRIAPDPLTGTSLCVEIIGSVIVFEDMQKLCPALSVANNLEVCAREDGTSLIGIVFENAYKPAKPQYRR